jgi:NADH-quinone oxidoreductase subunit L
MNYYLLIPFLPLTAFLVNILFGKKYLQERAHWVSILAVAGSWVVAVATLLEVLKGETVNIRGFFQVRLRFRSAFL